MQYSQHVFSAKTYIPPFLVQNMNLPRWLTGLKAYLTLFLFKCFYLIVLYFIVSLSEQFILKGKGGGKIFLKINTYRTVVQAMMGVSSLGSAGRSS